MLGVADLPLLSGLPKVELAKLLGDLETTEFAQGTVIVSPEESNEWVYFVIEGEVGIYCAAGEREIPLLFLGPGEVVGETDSIAGSLGDRWIRATKPTRTCRLPAARLRRLFSAEPAVADQFIRMLAFKLAGTMQELARTKTMLGAYTDELWQQIPTPLEEASLQMAAAAEERAPRVQQQPATADEDLQVPRPDRLSLLRHTAILVSMGLALLVYRLHPGDAQLAGATAILLWASLNWLLNTMPDYAVGLAAGAAALVTGVAPASVAFAGFASPSWFLLFGAGGIGVAVSRSGLLYRLALHMLRLLPPTYKGQTFAMALTGILFTPLLPSANSRVAMAGPLAIELSEAMRFPERGRGTAGLAMSTFLGFGVMFFMYMNGANTGLLAWSLLPAGVRDSTTWTAWFVTALPMAVLVFGGCYIAILWLYRPEPTPGVSRRTIRAQLDVLGPLSVMERQTFSMLALVLFGFLTQGLHGIDPSLLALSGCLILISLGVVDKQGLRSIDWGFLLLFGALVSIAEVTKTTGLSDSLAGWVGPTLQPLGASPYAFLGAIALLTLSVRLIIPLQPTVFVMVVSLSPVSAAMGYSPFVVALIILALSNNWIIPQQNSVYLGLYSATEERAFSHAQGRPLALMHALICLVSVLMSVPFWQFLNLVPR